MTINHEYVSAVGSLTAVDIEAEAGFSPVRLFWIKDVPIGVTRGKHAHKITNQYLMCVSGVVQLNTFDGKTWRTVVLFAGMSTLLPAMVWGEQIFLADNTVLLVACDTLYDRDDYIENMALFHETVTGLNAGAVGADINEGAPVPPMFNGAVRV